MSICSSYRYLTSLNAGNHLCSPIALARIFFDSCLARMSATWVNESLVFETFWKSGKYSVNLISTKKTFTDDRQV